MSKNLYRPAYDKEPLRVRVHQPEGGRYFLGIYNSAGERVVILREGRDPAPLDAELTWFGKNGSGEMVASGMYFIHYDRGDGVRKARVLLLR